GRAIRSQESGVRGQAPSRASGRTDGPLVLVDAVSSLGAIPFEADGWGLDVVVTGSQKGWMVPPGLAFVSMSERAWRAYENAKMARFYFDLGRHRDALPKGASPWGRAGQAAREDLSYRPPGARGGRGYPGDACGARADAGEAGVRCARGALGAGTARREPGIQAESPPRVSLGA